MFKFSTDNGGPVSQKASNYPLRGGKGTLWEGGVRGIGFVTGGNLSHVGVGGAPRISNALAHITDWNPTFCEMAGGCPLDSAQPLDGVSLSSHLKNPMASSVRTSITHDYCAEWMGGSCKERLDRTKAQIFASYFDGTFKLVVRIRIICIDK